MLENNDYTQKLNKMLQTLPIELLDDESSSFLREMATVYQFSFQDLKKIIDISIDLGMWKEESLKSQYEIPTALENVKQQKKKLLNSIEQQFEKLKQQKKSYTDFDVLESEYPKAKNPNKINNLKFEPSIKSESTTVLGSCPVASAKTLCCNLQTLDVVDNCGFECSYCSIQSFFPNNTILYEDKLASKLKRLELDPNKTYHIGTGQSSDSLLWGNKAGILDELMEFARKNPNVILEFKTKSKNISYFLNHDIPKNIVCTWSLNPDVIIKNEEHHTASLADRIKSARKLSDRGILVGFHLHPIIYYEGYEKDYQDLATELVARFSPNEVAMISLGTLTFTKPVLKEIRKKEIYSKILQMPFVDAAGKLSYPDAIKEEIFKHVYQSFALNGSNWHKEVFFYLCMEDHKYWPIVFGHSYSNNLEFEHSMKASYFSKINSRMNQPL